MIIPVLSFTDVRYDKWGEEPDDFYVCLDVYVCEEGSKNPYAYELFIIHIVSPKWLEKRLNDTHEMEIGRGYIITSNYNLPRIESKIKHLLTNCKGENWDMVIQTISRYGIWSDEG